MRQFEGLAKVCSMMPEPSNLPAILPANGLSSGAHFSDHPALAHALD